MQRDIHWTMPLKVSLQSGVTRTFSGVYEALDFLENEWPSKNGNRYKSAVSSCRGALNRTAPVAVARDAFVAACHEAGVGVTTTMPPYRTAGDHRTGLR